MSSNLPALIPASTVEHFGGRERIDLIRDQIAKGVTAQEFALFLAVAERTGLDPFARQIYAIPRSGRMTIQTGIDGYRAIADRHPAYAGSDRPVFEWVDTDDGRKLDAAIVTVWKMNGHERVPFVGVAYWDEYGSNQGLWSKMPRTMLAKCAEAQALRKAFPAQLAGVYTHEEMAQADADGDPWRVHRDELIARARALPETYRAKLRGVGDPRVMLPDDLLAFEKELAFCETAAQADADEQVVDAELVDDPPPPMPADDTNDPDDLTRRARYMQEKAAETQRRRAMADRPSPGDLAPPIPVGADA